MQSILKPKIIIFNYDLDSLDFLCCELYDTYDIYPISETVSITEILATIDPDLIIIDLDSTDNLSAKFLISQTKQPHLQAIPLLLTASNDKIQSRALLKNHTYIAKPYTLNYLQECISQQLIKL